MTEPLYRRLRGAHDKTPGPRVTLEMLLTDSAFGKSLDLLRYRQAGSTQPLNLVRPRDATP